MLHETRAGDGRPSPWKLTVNWALKYPAGIGEAINAPVLAELMFDPTP